MSVDDSYSSKITIQKLWNLQQISTNYVHDFVGHSLNHFIVLHIKVKIDKHSTLDCVFETVFNHSLKLWRYI